MFQFPGFPSAHYWFMYGSAILHRAGFPIRKSAAVSLICSLPQLIAACHVLLRLLMPRHSLYALLSLNFCYLYRFWFSLAWIACVHIVYSYFRLAKLFILTQFILFFYGKTWFLFSINVFSLCFVLFVYFLLYSVFNEHQPAVSPAVRLTPVSLYELTSSCLWTHKVRLASVGGLKWTRTTDLALIRRAL